MLLVYMIFIPMGQARHISLRQPYILKPYFYVLNNLLRATIDPKIGDATTVQNHAPTILVCFGLEKRFSVTDLMWRHIQKVSLTSSQSFPYAPYLMYIIEQVTGFGFHHDITH